MLNPLELFLLEEIRQKGPLPLDLFHEYALFHPLYGYYKTQRILGQEGDFVTAPEVSSLFCDVVAALLLHEWEQLGSPEVFSLIELGPGRGTLMAHILKTARLRPAFQKGARVTLFEINPFLCQEQAQRLASYDTTQWVSSLEQLIPLPGPFLVVANEFFDVFPIKQWDLSDSQNPVERKVIWTEDSFQISPSSATEHIQEESPQADAFFKQLLTILKEKSGFLWLADYGSLLAQRGDSWQGLYRGKLSSPLMHVGLTDLSAHVKFNRFVESAESFSVQGPMTQRDFLFTHGISERVALLKQNRTPAQKAQLEAAFMRLTHPLQMGDLFKVLMIRS